MSYQPTPSPLFTGEIPPEVRKQMELAILCGRVNCALSGSDIWDSIPCEGGDPTPEDVIVWAAAEVLRRLALERAAELQCETELFES